MSANTLVSRNLLLDEETAQRNKTSVLYPLPSWEIDSAIFSELVNLSLLPKFYTLPLLYPVRLVVKRGYGFKDYRILRIQIDAPDVDESLQYDFYGIHMIDTIHLHQFYREMTEIYPKDSKAKDVYLKEIERVKKEVSVLFKLLPSEVLADQFSEKDLLLIPEGNPAILSLFLYQTPVGQPVQDIGGVNIRISSVRLLVNLVSQLMDQTLTFTVVNKSPIIEIHRESAGSLTIRLGNTSLDSGIEKEVLIEKLQLFEISLPNLRV